MKEVMAYLIVINIVGFLLMGIDKYKARKGLWRIKEKTFFIVGMVGGSVGGIVGMYVFRHKTKHASFVYGLPIILTIQVILIIMINF